MSQDRAPDTINTTRCRGTIHGSINLAGLLLYGQTALAEIAAILKTAFE